MRRLEGAVAVVTGAGGALGGASARLFAREGARVAVVDRERTGALETVQAIEGEGGEALLLEADVTDENQVARVFDAVAARWGRLDVLFNNAGIMPHQDHSVLDLEPELWTAVYRANVLGTALASKHGIPLIERSGGGSVINMSSFVAFMGCSNPQEAYGASKGAVVALTRSMAVQFGPAGIRVNALCPGPVLTDHVAQFFPTEEARAIRLRRIPLGRFGEPRDVAEAALFLASDASRWLTGQAIILDGGISSFYF